MINLTGNKQEFKKCRNWQKVEMLNFTWNKQDLKHII